jgi:hypothetical protein
MDGRLSRTETLSEVQQAAPVQGSDAYAGSMARTAGERIESDPASSSIYKAITDSLSELEGWELQ